MEARIRIVGIIIQDEKLLMVKGKGYSELWTPGGTLEGGENDEECLRRELKEETNGNLLSAKFFREYNGHSFYHPEKKLIERVYVSMMDGEIKPDPNSEIESIIWFTKNDFKNKKFPMITHTETELIPDIIKAGIW